VNTNPDDRERRLATILAADILGYSRLMDADEEGTYAALFSARSEVIEPKIKKHRARIVKHTGDGFLAEFPTVLSAVKFAMELQEEMARRAKDAPKDLKIKFRIGINLGDIIVDDTGDIFGDGVNIAARLETLGIPGGICISGAVYDAVHKKLKVKFDDLGGQKVKNIPEKVHAYDIRWPGEGGTHDERAVKAKTKRKSMIHMAMAAVAAVALIWVAVWQLGPSEPEVAAIPENSIAVLAFVNRSNDPEQDYFSEGFAEDILYDLANLEGLKVTARTSAFSFKGKNVPIIEIAKALRVANILEGSVRKVGDQVRITAQLIHAEDGFALWTETFDITMADIFEVQDEIKANVAGVLGVEVPGDTRVVQTTNPEAYIFLLQARHMGRQGAAEGYEKSIALYKQALAIDPDYASAWAGLAITYSNQTARTLRPLDEGYWLAREAASKAIALDPADAQPHRTLARIAQLYERDFVVAAKHFEKALALDPTDVGTAASFLASLGRLDQAIALTKYSVARNPVSPVRHGNLGFNYLNAERPDEAIASYRTALTLSPGFIGAHHRIGSALLQKGEPEAALVAMQKEAFEALRLLGLVMAYHALGQATASDAALAVLIEKYETGWAYNIAYVLAYRGEADRAFEWLDKAVLYKDGGLSEIAIQPLFANIHDDPRWLPFLESIGKSPEQLAAIELNVTLPE